MNILQMRMTRTFVEIEPVVSEVTIHQDSQDELKATIENIEEVLDGLKSYLKDEKI